LIPDIEPVPGDLGDVGEPDDPDDPDEANAAAGTEAPTTTTAAPNAHLTLNPILISPSFLEQVDLDP
jgi:hypothetical protein